MKLMRFALGVLLLSSVSAFATQARVESMGKTSTFIMDDISIFDNPSNINLYPNHLIGELGNYLYPTNTVGANRDPLSPWFGGIFSLEIGANKALSIAGVFNRRNEQLFRFLPDYVIPETSKEQGFAVRVPTPVTNFDGFLGANLDNIALGLHIYVAHQDGMTDEGQLSSDAFASILQLDAGTNIVLSNSLSTELTIGAIRIQYGPDKSDGLFDTDLLSLFTRIRFFSRIDAINGNLIPAASIYNFKVPGREEVNMNAGIGVDVAFDRGFFWMGLNGFYNDKKAHNWTKQMKYDQTVVDSTLYTHYYATEINKNEKDETLREIGGVISFGIERNIWTDWFVIRVGGQKVIAYSNFKPGDDNTITKGKSTILCPDLSGNPCAEKGNYFSTNPINDGTISDNVGFGIGVNIEEKLKIDATISEDLLFRNPFQGGGRIISRISASYSF